MLSVMMAAYIVLYIPYIDLFDFKDARIKSILIKNNFLTLLIQFIL